MSIRFRMMPELVAAVTLIAALASGVGAQDGRDAAIGGTILAPSASTLFIGSLDAPGRAPHAAVALEIRSPVRNGAAAERSRSRGARRGFLIGAACGALIGLAITNDFMDAPIVNVAVGVGFFGLVGAGIGALVGVEEAGAAAVPPSTPGRSREALDSHPR